ncbi:MAG: hypothetical protein MJY67_00835, partial [Bacteroidales bacterium]|nr:hypothetical protein [Bacteroidales bacterium]
YGSFETFDKALQGGSILVCAGAKAWESPIGVAFEKSRAAGITNLYHTDNKHPNRNGAYLKACVNYLLLYGERFDGNAPDCQVASATAKQLRDIAESVVFDNTDQWKNPDASKVTPGDGLEPKPGQGEVDPDSIVQGENGIRTAEQLMSFAALYNAGGHDMSSYQNEAGEYELLADIDLKGKAWIPVGSVASTAYNSTSVPTNGFEGTFNGGGHTIKNLEVNISTNQTNFGGFFGATKNAVIKDVNFEGAKSDFTTSGISSNNVVLGIVVGYAYNTKLNNVHVNASFTGKCTSTSTRCVQIGGLVGMITSAGAAYDSAIEDCSFSGSMTNDVSAKYSNTNTVNIAGIAGAVTNGGKLVLIKNCVNNATINVKGHRAAGIVSTAFFSYIENCVNKGDITISYSASHPSLSISGTRTGGIIGYCSHTSANSCLLLNCENQATITSSEADSAVGGVAGLIRCFALKDCRNTGNVVCVSATRGLLVGTVTSADSPSTFANCSLKGSIGASASSMTTATAENYLSLGISFADGVTTPSWNADNIKFIQ